MKKILLVLLVGISTSAFSQEYGIRGGVNISKEKISDSGVSVTSDGSTSFLAGFYANFSVDDQIAISPELIYHVDGGRFNFPGLSGKDKISYISVPVLLKFYPTEKFNIHAGPQLGFLIDAETEVNGTTMDSSDGVKSTNFSFAFGGELSLTSMNLGIRYVAGLSNISDIDGATGTIKLNTLQIYLSVPLN